MDKTLKMEYDQLDSLATAFMLALDNNDQEYAIL